MIIALLIISLIVITVLFIKTKLTLNMLMRWIIENNYSLPDKQDMESFAEKITDKWFKNK